MKELSPVERCKKNGWKKGDTIRSVELEWGNYVRECWKITGFGKYEVLGIRTDLPPFTTSSETIIPIGQGDLTWRRV
jgi:hypothetical protein